MVLAGWTNGIEAFAGPAFVPAAHLLARVDGVENALLFGGAHGRLLFQGPGAGPEITAATVLDDVREIAAGVAPAVHGELRRAAAGEAETGWMLTLEGSRLPRAVDLSDLFAAHGVYTHRATALHAGDGRESRSLLAWPCSRGGLNGALDAITRAAGCRVTAVRALEDGQ